jgi:hypothetical protein
MRAGGGGEGRSSVSIAEPQTEMPNAEINRINDTVYVITMGDSASSSCEYLDGKSLKALLADSISETRDKIS